LPSDDNGGTIITGYEIYVDAGNDFTSNFNIMPAYDGTSTIYGATNTVDFLILGRTYRFKTRSKNVIGFSDFSEESYIAYGDVPNTPTAPTLDSSTRTSISV
jgi:hypothetical protein